jgi:hypothetical protein
MTSFDDSDTWGMNDTWGMKPRFKLRQMGMDGPLFLAVDPLSEPLPILSDGFLGLEFKPGTSREDAMTLLDQLTDMVAFVTYTGGQPVWNPTPGRSGKKPTTA